jgi:4-hydroxythreonine-4-phosphate dehydrogenase
MTTMLQSRDLHSNLPPPLLAITIGDPNGIGPEIIVKALQHDVVWTCCRPVIVGSTTLMRRAVKLCASSLPVVTVEHPKQATDDPHRAVFVLDRVPVPDDLKLGTIDPRAGHAAFESIRIAIELAMANEVDGTITAPLHKESLNLAGHHFPGHTEIFASLTNTPDVAMMLAEGDFRVVHVSTHVSLRQACDLATRPRVLKTIQLADDACRQLGIERPLIAVAGLNPHAGDGGLFGDEEIQHIIPAIEDARATGIRVEGPLPADTLFPRAVAGAYDCVVAMYHDQGHVPLKLAGFRYEHGKWTGVRGINITLGLPIIRVSVDHGTAFDQAGKATASEQSMVQAIEYAARLAMIRDRGQ